MLQNCWYNYIKETYVKKSMDQFTEMDKQLQTRQGV